MRFLLTFIAFFFVNTSFSETKNPARLDASIVCVKTTGYWKIGERDGEYRIIIKRIGWEDLKYLAFLQWIETDHDNEKNTILTSIPIKELNDGWSYIGDVNYSKKDNQFRINYSKRFDQNNSEYEIHIVPSEEDEFTYTSISAKTKAKN